MTEVNTEIIAAGRATLKIVSGTAVGSAREPLGLVPGPVMLCQVQTISSIN